MNFSTRGLRLSLILGVAAFALDRAYKYLQIDVLRWTEGHFTPVTPFFDVGLVWNQGISYGLLGSLPLWGIGVLVAFALAALVVWWVRSDSALVRAGLALCIGGAVSNALDRAVYGAVADSFWLHPMNTSLFVFNVADATITAGVVLLILDLLGIRGKRAANAA